MFSGLSRGFRLDENSRRTAYSLVLFLLASALLSGAIFAMPRPLGDLVAAISLCVFAWSIRPMPSEEPIERNGRPYVRLLMALLLATLLATHLLEGPVDVLVLGLFLLGADWLRRRTGRPHRDLAAMQLTALLYAVFLLLQQYVSYVHYATSAVAAAFSSAAGVFVRGDVSMGAGYAGLQLTVLFLLHALSVFIFAEEKRSPLGLAATFLALLTCDFAYVVAAAWMSQVHTVVHFTALLQPFAAPWDYRLLLFAFLSIPIVAYRLGSPPRETVAVVDRRVLATAGTLAALVVVAALALTVNPAAGERVMRVVVLDSVGNMTEDLPSFESFGLKRVGQFGLLPTYLKGSGYDTEVVEEIDAETLAGAGTLVVINLRQAFDDETKQAIWEFVGNGGSLLVAGDHTGREEIRDPSNDLLEPVGISLNFDSAIPLRDGWLNSYALRPHPVLNGIADPEVQVAVGASLDVSPSARPVIIGRAGYSDAGNADNKENGFLGDMAFSQGERMGDVVLAADATYARGKVMVFGDTTLFQNPVISRSYRFVDNIFAWLSGRNDATRWALLAIVAAVALVIGAGLVAFRAASGVWVTAVPLAALAITLAVSGLLARPPAPAWEDRGFEGRYAVIDASHFELSRLDRSGDAVDGLVVNLLRNGYTPFVMGDFSGEMIAGAKLLVLPAPMKPFTVAETDAIDSFVDAGGLLVLTAGSERPSGPYALLEHFGYRLGAVPLGPASSLWGRRKVSFWSAWPLEYEANDEVEVIAEAWDYPVMVYRRQGAGGVLVVADSAFLQNKNLEDVDTHNADNILFLRDLLETYGEGGGGDS